MSRPGPRYPGIQTVGDQCGATCVPGLFEPDDSGQTKIGIQGETAVPAETTCEGNSRWSKVKNMINTKIRLTQ